MTSPDARPVRSSPTREVPYLLNSVPGRLFGAPLAFAHRGADPARENTMAAFARAVDLGFRYLETDVRTARCGTLVVFHDEELDRVTTGSGRIGDHTWEELATVRIGATGDQPGESLVRFEDLLTAWEDVHLNVDLKDEAAVGEFVRLVEAHHAHDRVLAASFDDARRRRVTQGTSRPIASSTGWVDTALMVLLGPLGLMPALRRRIGGVDCLQVPVSQAGIRVVTRRFIARCHRAGLQVHVWVIDDAAEMERLLDLGVDGLMTDSPEVLAGVMARRSVWPQR